MNHPIFYTLLLLIAGFGIPVMAAINSKLGVSLNNPILATTILFLVGLILSIIILLFNGIPEKIIDGSLSWYAYSAGFFVIFYIVSITYVAPRFGMSNAISCVLLGQMVAMSVIDHFGLWGAPQVSLSFWRGVGVVGMAVSVLLVVQKI